MGLVSTGLVLTGDMGEITVRVGGGEGGEGRVVWGGWCGECRDCVT